MMKPRLLATTAGLLLVAIGACAFWSGGAVPPGSGSGNRPANTTSDSSAPAASQAKTPTVRDVVSDLSSTKSSVGRTLEDAPWILTGSVTNPDGSPAVGAAIVARADTFYFGQTGLPATTTNSAGNYVFDLSSWRHASPLDRQQVGLMVAARLPKVGGQVSAQFPANAKEDQPLTIRADIRLSRCATVTGRVVDVDGQPVADARVRLQTDPAADDIYPPIDYSDRDGFFHIAIGMVGPHELVAIRQDLGVATHKLDIVHCAHAAVPELVMRPASELAGQVVYPDGQPVANTHLLLDGYDHVDTDALGRFLVRHVSPGKHTLSPPGQPQDRCEVLSGEGIQRVVVQSALLRQEFRDHDGKSLRPQAVAVRLIPAEHGAAIQNAKTFASLPAVVRAAAVTHYEHGADLFAPRGSWFWIESEHGAKRPCLCVGQMRTDANETLAELRFEKPTLDAQLHVIAKHEDGSLVTNLFVALEPLTRGARVPFEDDVEQTMGKAMRVPAGTYQLGVWEGWREQYPSTFRVDEVVHIAPNQKLTKEVTLRQGGLIALDVRSHGRAPGERIDAVASVQVAGADVLLGPYRVAAPGKFRDAEQAYLCAAQWAKSSVLLPPGEHVVQLKVASEVWQARAKVVAGKHTVVRFDLDR